jgi:hypothetical protein
MGHSHEKPTFVQRETNQEKHNSIEFHSFYFLYSHRLGSSVTEDNPKL